MMTLHPDILDDLLVVYHAGEASTATQALLEELATQDAAFRQRLRSAEGMEPIDIRIPVDVQRRALSAIGHWNRLYSLFVGLACFLAALPLSFSIDDQGAVKFFFLRDSPGLASASLALAIATGIAAWRFRNLRRLD